MNSAYENGEYLWNNPAWHVQDSSWKARNVRAMLQRHHISPSLIGDSGCGAGEVLRQMSLYFPSAILQGYDVSPQAYRLASERTSDRLTFYNTDLAREQTVFDVVLALDVVEHVEDCFGFARSMRPRGKWFVFHFPLDLSCHALLRNVLITNRRALGHVHYFTKATATAFLRECGYEVVDSGFTWLQGQSPVGVLSRLACTGRAMMFRLAPAAAATVLGGISLLVLARSHA